MKALLILAFLIVLALFGDRLMSSFDELLEKYYHRKR